jgi:alpha-beta hydrolase superfamily lysophospholipase
MRTIQFDSKDGLAITADLYESSRPKGWILLCHRSHFNRGEYKNTATKLQQLGYTCMAIDQRSGMNVLGYTNETSTRAKKLGLPTGYLDAKPDIESAMDYLYKLSNRRSILLLGSSYSASLCLLIAVASPIVEAVITYSPGEYLKDINLSTAITNINVPIYATAAKKEMGQVALIFAKTNQQLVSIYTPSVIGAHGSRVLWDQTPGNAEYWESLINFLNHLQ